MDQVLKKPSSLIIIPELAEAIGLNESIVLYQIHYWICMYGEKHIHEGKPWIYNTQTEWQKNFSFWSPRTIRSIFYTLESKEIIQSKEFKREKGDRTKWYTINYSKVEGLLDPICDQLDPPCGKICHMGCE